MTRCAARSVLASYVEDRSTAMTQYQEISRQFYQNRLLFGDPADAGIVALEIASPTEIEVFKRVGAKIVQERRPLELFVLLDDLAHLRGFRPAVETSELAGDFRYRYLVTFNSGDTLEALKRHLRDVTGLAANAPRALYLVFADPVEIIRR